VVTTGPLHAPSVNAALRFQAGEEATLKTTAPFDALDADGDVVAVARSSSNSARTSDSAVPLFRV